MPCLQTAEQTFILAQKRNAFFIGVDRSRLAFWGLLGIVVQSATDENRIWRQIQNGGCFRKARLIFATLRLNQMQWI
jgi:hypothetical protein